MINFLVNKYYKELIEMYKKNKKDYSRYKIEETLCELSKVNLTGVSI